MGQEVDEGGGLRAKRRLEEEERVNLCEARTETHHVKERRTEQEGRVGVSKGEQGVRAPSWGFDSPPHCSFCCFFSKSYVWNRTSFLS